MKKGSDLKWSIYKAGVVADLTVHKWGARSKLRAKELGLEEHDIPEQFRLGHKNLMKKEHLAKLRSIGGKFESFLIHNSFSFPFGDARFIPFNLVKKVLDFYKACDEEHHEALEEFLNDYDTQREGMLREYSEIFHEMLVKKHFDLDGSLSGIDSAVEEMISKLAVKYPTKDTLRKKFVLDFVVFEVSPPEFKSVSEVKAEKQAEHYMEVASLYKQKAGERIDSFLEDVIARLKVMVLKTTANMKKRLEGEDLGQNTIKAFVRFADTFKDMDFIGTDLDSTLKAFGDKIKDMEKTELSDEEVKVQLQTEVEAIEEKAMAMDIDLVVGRFLRRIDLGTEDDSYQKGYEDGINDGLSH